MSKHQDYVQKTEALVEPILQKHQFELVDVEFVKEAGSWHLRVYIDKEGGITIDDLTLVNHELSDEMDKDDFIEDTVLARVGEGIVSSIGSSENHKSVLENPDAISKLVLRKGLDAGTAFEILSIDIADIDIGRNIGASLQIDQANADKKDDAH